MKKEATPIEEVARGLIKDLRDKRSSKEERVKEAWRSAVGKKFYRHTQPTSFRKKRLVVNVDSSGWLYELTMRKQGIVAKLKKSLKKDFKELQLRIGQVEGQEGRE